MKFLAVIPARYASTRFPGKPLAILGDRPIIQWVYERTAQSFEHLCVATDDERIRQCVEQFGGVAVMTSSNHRSGTDRCAEALEKMGGDFDAVVNVQGDEPFIEQSQLETVKACLEDEAANIATLVQPFSPDDTWETLSNPNSPKVVVSDDGYALYFSRSVIPFLRGIEKEDWTKNQQFFKHIGLYAYKADTLRKITKLPQSPLEVAESLEQLRWLQAGCTIKVGTTQKATIGIDTPKDLEKAVELLKTNR